MNTKIIAALALVSLAAAPTFAQARSTLDRSDEIFGRPNFSVSSDLRDRGVDVQRVEEWGNLIRAFVTNPDGTTTMQFFDRDSLTPVNANRN